MFDYRTWKTLYRRWLLNKPARYLNQISGRKLKPHHLTLAGLVLHLPAAILIGYGLLIWGVLVFLLAALMDGLDGALARLQNTASDFGGWLDACSDRLSEIIIFSGLITYFLQLENSGHLAVLCLLTLGLSLLISYVKAKGEGLWANRTNHPLNDLNERFGGGLLNYEQRVLILALMMISQLWLLGFIVLLLSALVTLAMRGHKVYKVLQKK